MTQTTDPVDPRTQMPLATIDELQRRVLLSLANQSRADLRAIRSLPTWRAVQWARVAFKGHGITRAELDAIIHEAASTRSGGVKPDKRKAPVVTDAAVEVVCAGLYHGWDQCGDEFRAERRIAVHGLLAAAAARMDWSGLVPDEHQLALAIADPSSVLPRRRDEPIARWGARAVGQRLRQALFGSA